MTVSGTPSVLIEAPGRFSLCDDGGAEMASGEARVRLHADSLAVAPEFGEPLLIALRHILGITDAEHQVEMPLSSNETLRLTHLGYGHAGLVRGLRRQRGEVLLRDLLMHEPLRKPGVGADLSLLDREGRALLTGRGEIRVYETGLVVLPDDGLPHRIPLGEIEHAGQQDRDLVVRTEWGETLTVSKLGREFDPLTRELAAAISALGLRAQGSLEELAPLADPAVVRSAARFLGDGKAARRIDIDEVSAELWPQLERMLDMVGIRAEYDFLASLAQPERMCIGVKRGLVGGPTGDYVWFLAPIYAVDAGLPGNAVAMEAGCSAAAGGRATYFFRLLDPDRYRALDELDELHDEADAAIRRLNRGMMAVNFRREPVYLPEERLREARYLKYHFAVEALPELRRLRSAFIGRVIHRNEEQWRGDVLDLLHFAATAGEGERWSRGASLDEPDEIFGTGDGAPPPADY